MAVSATDRRMSAMLQHFQEHRCWQRLSMWNREGEYGEYGDGVGRSGNTGIAMGLAGATDSCGGDAISCGASLKQKCFVITRSHIPCIHTEITWRCVFRSWPSELQHPVFILFIYAYFTIMPVSQENSVECTSRVAGIWNGKDLEGSFVA